MSRSVEHQLGTILHQKEEIEVNNAEAQALVQNEKILEFVVSLFLTRQKNTARWVKRIIEMEGGEERMAKVWHSDGNKAEEVSEIVSHYQLVIPSIAGEYKISLSHFRPKKLKYPNRTSAQVLFRPYRDQSLQARRKRARNARHFRQYQIIREALFSTDLERQNSKTNFSKIPRWQREIEIPFDRILPFLQQRYWAKRANQILAEQRAPK